MTKKANNIIDLRKEINDIDQQIAFLFGQRMEIVKNIGLYKKENNLPIEDLEREKKVIEKNLDNVKDENIKKYYLILLKEIIKISKIYQSEL